MGAVVMEMQRRSFLQLLASLPAFGATAAAFESIAAAPEAKVSASHTVFRHGQVFEGRILAIAPSSPPALMIETTMLDGTAKQYDTGMREPQGVSCEIVGWIDRHGYTGEFEVEHPGVFSLRMRGEVHGVQHRMIRVDGVETRMSRFKLALHCEPEWTFA